MIYLRVMNNLANNEEPLLLENFARGVSEIDRALDPVTKAELLGEANGSVANFNAPAGAMHFIDDVAAIMLFDLFLYRSHHVRRPQVHLLARRRSAGNEIRRAHAFASLPLAGDFAAAGDPLKIRITGRSEVDRADP